MEIRNNGGGQGNRERWRDRDRERFLACERSRVWGGERTGAALTVVMATQTNPTVPVNTTVCESVSKPKLQDRKEGGQQSPGYGDHPQRACTQHGWAPHRDPGTPNRGRNEGLLSEVTSPLGADRGKPRKQRTFI